MSRWPRTVAALGTALALLVATRAADAACVRDGDCAAPLPACDRATGRCVGCTTNTGCAAGLCELDARRAAFQSCVECTLDAGSACHPGGRGARCGSDGTCGCARDEDCGGARVCRAGVCLAGCRRGSRECAADEECSALEGIGTCVRRTDRTVPAAPPPPDASSTPGAAPPLTAAGGCGVASPASPLAPLSAIALVAAAALARRRRRVAAALAGLPLLAGCTHTPTPLHPVREGSVGLPHRGVLAGGVRVEETPHLKFLRPNDRRYATARFAAVLSRAAAAVGQERPGAPLVVGDLSAPRGGVLLPHLSHRSGRDADLLLYVTTLEGAPVASPGFVRVREDGLAWDERGRRFFRFDVARQWLLVRHLLADPEARVQFIFASRGVRAMLLEWAMARGEDEELVYRALTVLVQPKPGGEHDDHFHVRTACTDEEVGAGCERSGPLRAWLAPSGLATPAAAESTSELVAFLMGTATAGSVGASASAGDGVSAPARGPAAVEAPTNDAP